jgi:DNA polymerase elongation subunit (family B)
MKEIKFNIIDWREYNEEKIEDEASSEADMTEDSDSPKKKQYVGKYVIELFGRTEEDKSVYVKVEDFTPYFFVEIPRKWGKDENKIKLFINFIKRKVWNIYHDNLVAWDVQKRNKLYGFTGGKQFLFLRLVFNNTISMRKFSYIFYNKLKIPGLTKSPKMFKLYESNLGAMLRFMHIQDLESTGWVKINKFSKIKPKITNSDICISTFWKNIEKYENDKISPLKILSFDIECTSKTGDFPVATNKDDKIIQIGSTISRYGCTDCYYNNIITLGSCDEIEGVDVISCKTEEEVLLKWQELINKQKPDIITGYNIWGFDEKYIYERAELLGIRNYGYFSKKLGEQSKFTTKVLSSSALGDNNLRYYDCKGIIQIDLLKVIQRDYKLNSYKLDKVAENFIKGDVLSYNILEKNKKKKKNNKIVSYTSYYTELKITNIDDINKNNYIKIVVDGEDYFEDKKFKIIKTDKDNDKIYIKAKLDEEISKSKISWGLVKDDVKPQDIFKLQEGTSKDRKKIAEYCVMDCALCNRLIAKLMIVTNNIAMANVCSVPLSYIFLRGQGIKTQSLVAKACRQLNHVIPNLNYGYNKNNAVESGFEGATVFKPIIGFYKRPIGVLDYASLYPSSMIMNNISHEKLVDNPKYDNLPDYEYNDITYNETYEDIKGEKQVRQKTCRFAKNKDGKLGIIPLILKNLLSERKATKKEMKKETDKVKKGLLDGKQLALKITANSVYGQCGASTSTIYLKAIAASTTATGRYMLELARDYMENDFPIIVKNIYDALKKGDNKGFNNILDKELKERNNQKFIDIMKKQLIEIFDNYTIKPKTMYGDTDSVFIDYMVQDKDGIDLVTKQGLIYAINLGEIAGVLIKSRLRAPQDLEYEKTFWPFCIMSKKRYVGNKYEFDPNKFKQNSMGIVLKRRDNANVVKKIVGGMVDILLNEIDIEKAIKFIKTSLSDLLEGKYPIKDFITTKTLKKTYKDRTRIVHVCLADRMYARDPGSAPQVNTRIPFVTVDVNEQEIINNKLDKMEKVLTELILGLNKDMNLKELRVVNKKIKIPEYSNKITILLNKGLHNLKKDTIIKKYIKYKSYTKDTKVSEIIEDIKNKISYSIKIYLNKKINNTFEKLNKINSLGIAITEIKEKVYEKIYYYLLIGIKEIPIEEIIHFTMKILEKKARVIQGDRVEHPDYIKENNLKVDYLFYITNQIMKPSIQFLSLLTDEAEDIFNKIINDEKEIRNLRNNKSKNKRRIKMLNKKNKKSIKIIDNWFKNENQTDSESGSSGTESNSDSESEEDKNIKKVRKVKKKSKFALFL